MGTIKETPQIVPLTLRELANLGINVTGHIEEDLEKEVKYLSDILNELNLKDKYKVTDPYIIKALIMGTVNTYYSMHMSDVNMETLKDFEKNAGKVLDYLDEFIFNILIDALCKEEMEKLTIQT